MRDEICDDGDSDGENDEHDTTEMAFIMIKCRL